VDTLTYRIIARLLCSSKHIPWKVHCAEADRGRT
jgi:hypothetical protein